MQRVTPEQAAVFAGYDEQDAATTWYRAAPKLLAQTQSNDSRADEFAWLRDLALDHADLTAALAACEADYAAAVRALYDIGEAWMPTGEGDDIGPRADAILSTPRARKVVGA
jgi:hypothetical protein